VYDATLDAGIEISNIDITPKMVATVRQSNAAYCTRQHLKQSREIRPQKVTEHRKRKALISSREQQKRLKLDELKSQAAKIDKQIADPKSSK